MKITNVNLHDIAGNSFTFNSYKELYFFLEEEANFWSKSVKKLTENNSRYRPSQVIQSSLNMTRALDAVGNCKKDLEEKQDFERGSTINNAISNSVSTNKWLWSGSHFCKHVLQIDALYGENGVNAFLMTADKKQIRFEQNFNSFMGMMLGYEFLEKDLSIGGRLESEKASLEYLRSKLNEQTQNLVSKGEEQEAEWKNFLASAEKENESLVSLANKNFENLAAEQRKEQSDNLTRWTQEISQLKDTYENKLKLEAPVSYWESAAKSNMCWGVGSLFCLILWVVTGLLLLEDLFVTWLSGDSKELGLGSLQGVVIFATMITVFGYVGRALSKLMFSSFHLMRDAQERSKLVYVYLALVKQNAIDEKSLQIVLQALFSRADSGLLGADSSPTMPQTADLVPKSNASS